MKYTMACGCSFDINEEVMRKHNRTIDFYEKNNLIPPIVIDYYNLPDCKLVWEMLGAGYTKGVFQLESNFGRSWTKKLKPTCLEHLSALGAILRPGCVSEDTNISIGISDREGRVINCKKITIKQLYEKFVRNHNLLKNNIISLNEEDNLLFKNTIKDVIHTGKKEVFRVKIRSRLSNNYEDNSFHNLECTLDHKLLTHDRGWVELENLVVGERIAVVRRKNKKKQSKYCPGEKYFQTICFYNYKYNCLFCDWKDGSLDVNHIDGNRKTNNLPENLCFFCPNHHRMYSEKSLNKEDILKKQEANRLKNSDHIQWVEYNGKESKGVKDVYDISVEGPNHNFIAGNFVVHNCTQSIDENGISLTEHYCRRKNGEEPVTYPDKILEPILKETYGVMAYQEQSIEIAKIVAGLSLGEADNLRRGIGKKLPEVIAQCKITFLEGAKKVQKVPESVAISIFDSIEASQRYAFNKAHSFAYGINGYRSAYAKIHMPLWFFCSYLRHSGDKQKPYEEIAELVNEAKLFGIELHTPSIANLRRHFHLASDRGIRFGIVDIKNIGDSHYNKLVDVNKIAIQTYGKPLHELEWYQFLILSENLSKTAVENLIFVGAMDCYD